ncbi:SGNH/GDSL hydrolase family protein [Metabacillus halosaccharovorans]|uniref:SGNH/GDSL hydrolase family protein n=1 Tax=Metabacillus halosaccharovorans TaxID=930124 RepID=UPI001C1F8736|nr:SGNH/GDSL hydrolase family protein [Metabacillus halosaccharovorans]MBU7591165.1 SGNH/GDSL hydrolase family protein [Metabacillus halosaccharovorans]
MKLLFIGDSITRCGRHEDPEGIGSGYVRLIHDYYKTNRPTENYEFINRGVGGDRIIDLNARWEQDVIQINPDMLSISIGINDVWRQLDSRDQKQIYPEEFEHIYVKLLNRVREKTKAEIVLMEPTVIEEDIEAEGNQKLKSYVKIIHKLSDQFEATLVPTHQAFLTFLKAKADYKLTRDGVHMNSAGNMLMATTWLNNVNVNDINLKIRGSRREVLNDMKG